MINSFHNLSLACVYFLFLLLVYIFIHNTLQQHNNGFEICSFSYDAAFFVLKFNSVKYKKRRIKIRIQNF